MHRLQVQIGQHLIFIATDSAAVRDWVQERFMPVVWTRDSKGYERNGDLSILILDGYGTSFSGYDVDINVLEDKITYRRADYCIEVDSRYREAYVRVYDDFALKHAMLNLYGTYIVHHQWGLLIHSSCVIEKDRAYLFSGRSGAGKSTVAQMSRPRRLVSDEATLVRIRPAEVCVFDSPFRSETKPEFVTHSYPIAGIHMLRQATYVSRCSMKRVDAMSQLIDKVFYWSYNPSETHKLMKMLQIVASSVPVYELHFQKNDSFWEAIS